MRNGTNSKRVYSTAGGRICPRCGWPAHDCKCSHPSEEIVPARPVAKLRIERKARGGKTVTVIDGLDVLLKKAFIAIGFSGSRPPDGGCRPKAGTPNQ